VPGFVIGGDLLFFHRKNMTPALRSQHNFFDRTDQIKLADFVAILPGRQDRRFIHERSQVGTGKARGALADDFDIDVFRQLVFWPNEFSKFLRDLRDPVGQ